jgi:hypothetical protein
MARVQSPLTEEERRTTLERLSSSGRFWSEHPAGCPVKAYTRGK